MANVWNVALTARGCVLADRDATHEQPSVVAAGIVRWVRGHDYGIKTLVMDRTAQAHLSDYTRERAKAL